MSRLLVLGAGPFQLAGIKKAVDQGHEVITADHTPENIGHRFSHRSVECSTTDAKGVLDIARSLEIDGICTFSSDVAVPAVAHVCTELGLPGVSRAVAKTMSLKHEFRSFLQTHDLPHPKFISGSSFSEVAPAIDGLRFPVIFKPVDTSGSRGVTELSAPDPAKARQAFETARNFSRSGLVCVEEFLHGTEVGGDAVVANGRIAFIAITHKHLKGFVVTGHSLPASIDSPSQARVVSALEQCCAALGYTDGVLNFDVMTSEDQISVLEMGPRNGGNGIAAIIAHATGVDVEIAAIQLALGLHPDLQEAGEIRGAGSWVFGSDHSGTLLHLKGAEEVRRDVPELLELHQAIPLGADVQPFMHGGNMVGYALFDCPAPSDYETIVERLNDSMQLRVGAP